MEPLIIVAVITAIASIVVAVVSGYSALSARKSEAQLATRLANIENSQRNYDQLQEDVARLRGDFDTLQIRYWILDDYVGVLRESLVTAGITPPAYPSALVRIRHKEGE